MRDPWPSSLPLCLKNPTCGHALWAVERKGARAEHGWVPLWAPWPEIDPAASLVSGRRHSHRSHRPPSFPGSFLGLDAAWPSPASMQPPHTLRAALSPGDTPSHSPTGRAPRAVASEAGGPERRRHACTLPPPAPAVGHRRAHVSGQVQRPTSELKATLAFTSCRRKHQREALAGVAPWSEGCPGTEGPGCESAAGAAPGPAQGCGEAANQGAALALAFLSPPPSSLSENQWENLRVRVNK